ncbi:MAG TPA: hypothetical protein VKT80_09610 [Chloroflexota bacterium]|nr:hypothetical protein [Chloroflexota bacterium]
MDQEKEQVSLSNLCGGGIEEVFQREFAAVLANIADVNTDPEAKRKISLEFTIAPFEDRSGAQITFTCKSKTVPVDAVKGTVFLQRRGLVMVAMPHDPRQQRMFDGKPAIANDVQ